MQCAEVCGLDIVTDKTSTFCHFFMGISHIHGTSFAGSVIFVMLYDNWIGFVLTRPINECNSGKFRPILKAFKNMHHGPKLISCICNSREHQASIIHK